MGFNGGLKAPLKSNDDGSKTTIYPSDVVSWEATTVILNHHENASFL